MIYLQLFINFVQIGLFSIGGGYAAIPLIQEVVVKEHGWLSMSSFTDLITIAEMTPGPIAVNSATFVGLRIGGIAGAVAATFGCIFPSLFIVSFLAYLYRKYKNLTGSQSVLGCLRPAVAALIASSGVSMLLLVVFGDKSAALSEFNVVGAVLFAGAFFVLRKWKKNPILVMSSCGVIGVLAGLINLW
ncbi:MAG: chromate transporter [Lachnospiraceae bacterium]|nr:chromate transporter [Lachnospiraceae bacterium]